MSVEPIREGGKLVGWRVRWREAGRGSPQRQRTFWRRDGFRRPDVDAFAQEIAKRKRLGTLAELDTGAETLAEFVEVWWENVALPDLAPKTRDQYAWAWDRWVLPRLGAVRLRDLTVEQVQDYRRQIEKAGANPPTVRRALVVLQGVLSYAHARGRIATNPVASVRKPRIEAREGRALTVAEIEALRRELADPAERALVGVLAYQAPRPFEALRLTWGDVRERTMRIRDAKRRKTRTAPIRPAVAVELAELRLAAGRPGDRAAVFGAWEPHDWNNWRRRHFHPAARAAGLEPPRLVPYDLRHTAVSLWIAEGRDVLKVAQWAGHSPQVCLATYAHLFDEHADGRTIDVDALIADAREGPAAGRRGVL